MDQQPEPHDDTTRTLPPFQHLSESDPVETASVPKRLYRSRDRKLFMGVCGGLADYFDADPTLVRAIFAAGSLLGGASVFIYLALIFIMPAEDQIDANPRAAAQSSLDEATAELQRGVDTVVKKVKSLTGRKTPPA